MKAITFTSAQVQNFIHNLDGEDCPILLNHFYLNHHDEVYKKNKNWNIEMNYTAIQWLKKELKSYIEFLKQEIKDVTSNPDVDQYWKDEAKYHKIRIKLAERTIAKLN